MSRKPLVSVIVPTKNSSEFLSTCLDSIQSQTYKNIELIIVDNNSEDDTKEIAKKYTKQVYNRGPERSAQVNYGVKKAKGGFVYKVDSDFVLDKHVVSECVSKSAEGFDAVVVHNSPDVSAGWIAKIRKFEIDMYKYDLTHSSARFVGKQVYERIGGYTENITAGEDYDFQNRLNREGYKTGFIETEALHLGEPKKILPHLMKYYFYGKDFVNYQNENKSESRQQLSPLRATYVKNWKRFLTKPAYGLAFAFYLILKFSFGGAGYIVKRLE